MGYYQSAINNHNFHILIKDIPACYVAIIKDQDGAETVVDESVSTDMKIECIQDFLEKANFTSEEEDYDDNPRLVIGYDHNKCLSTEDHILSVIAPFIEEEAYLEMEGEDNSIWRWVKLNGKISNEYPTISWAYEAELQNKKGVPLL